MGYESHDDGRVDLLEITSESHDPNPVFVHRFSQVQSVEKSQRFIQLDSGTQGQKKSKKFIASTGICTRVSPLPPLIFGTCGRGAA